MRNRFPAILLLVLPFLVWSACEDDVADAEKTERPFTLYGYLDPRSAVQPVRVFPVQPLLERVGPMIDAEVTFQDLERGVQYAATDSVVPYASGEHAHVFNGHFQARYGSPYRIEVKRSDGAVSTVDVTVPAEVSVEEQQVFITRGPDTATPRPHIPLFFRGEPTWIARATAIYDVELYELFAARQYRLTYDYVAEQVEGGWVIDVDLTGDFERIRDRLIAEFGPIVSDYQTIFQRLRLEVDVVNEGWYPPTGRFDAELLVEPGLMTNVENGFGFVGSGYRVAYTMEPPECLLFWAGYAFTFGPCGRADYCTYTGTRCDE